jgi:hypothetical protein
MRGNGRVGEIGSAAPTTQASLSSALKSGEDRIAVVDGKLRIMDQMREAELADR